MIGTSRWDYLHIQFWICLLSAVTPLCACYCIILAVHFLNGLSLIRLPLLIELWTITETAFFLCVYLPNRVHQQNEANHPLPPCRERRRAIFARCTQTMGDPDVYLQKWFLGGPLAEIKRDNLKEFFLWAFFNRGGALGDDDEELEEYVRATEEVLGRKLEDGRGAAKCLRLTIDEVKMLRRSLLWYFCVGFVDMLTSVRLCYYDFSLYRTPLPTFLSLFPWRPLVLLTSKSSLAKHTSYWLRPHTSKTKLPIVFIHGIGIGLYPYVNFLAELNNGNDAEDQIGVLAIEIMQVSFRMTNPTLRKDLLCSEICDVIEHHGWQQFVLVSHSYGSTISTHLLKYKPMSEHIAAVVLIDPITFLLHQPDVAYNFTYRLPIRANEHQLYYFASMDPGVSHALSRCFFWSENILWKEDIDRPMTVSLAANDLIVNTSAVHEYLTPGRSERYHCMIDAKPWNLEVIWNRGIDHAQIFDTARGRGKIIHAIRAHCRGRQSSSKA